MTQNDAFENREKSNVIFPKLDRWVHCHPKRQRIPTVIDSDDAETVTEPPKRMKLIGSYPDELKSAKVECILQSEENDHAAQLIELTSKGLIEDIGILLNRLDMHERNIIIHHNNDHALRMAAKHHHWNVVFLLLDIYHANIHAVSDVSDQLGNLPINDCVIMHACYDGDVKVVDRLLKEFHRERLCTEDPVLSTRNRKIDVAVEQGFVDVLQSLINHGETTPYPLHEISRCPSTAKLPIMKILWPMFLDSFHADVEDEKEKFNNGYIIRPFSVLGYRKIDASEVWTDLLLQLDDAPTECLEWFWSNSPNHLIDLERAIRKYLEYRSSTSLCYRFAEFLIDKGAIPDLSKMCLSGHKNHLSTLQWLHAKCPAIMAFINLNVIQTAVQNKQLQLVEWIFQLEPGGKELQTQWKSFEKECTGHKSTILT